MTDGFYWLNDPNRYGWEPVEVKDGKLWRCGVKYEDWASAYSDCEWRQIFPPN